MAAGNSMLAAGRNRVTHCMNPETVPITSVL